MGSGTSTTKKKPSTPHSDKVPPKKDEEKKEEKKDDKNLKKDVKNDDNVLMKDLMISYSHQDKEMMQKLRDNLENNGISVWVDVIGLSAGVDFLSKIGQAILDAKLFISLLSKNSIKSKYCQDEVALAYISEKAIFPVALQTDTELFQTMDTGLKLQLGGLEWNYFLNPESFDEDFSKLLEKLKSELQAQMKQVELGKKAAKRLRERQKIFQRQQSEKIDPKVLVLSEDYWKQFYSDKESVLWTKFLSDFCDNFQDQMSSLFSKSDQDWLMENLRNEMEDESDLSLIFRQNFLDFCTIEGEKQSVWRRVEDYSKEMYAIQEVFSMDSSVRVEAIESLGQFQSPAVIESLRDLLRNKESNIRAVAAVSLAKTGNKDKQTIRDLMKCLNDKDRLVREAGCLALGHIQAQEAVKKLLHLWRNDFISHVREAAQAALTQIGGEEVDKAMQITKVLADEIRLLTEEN